MLEHMYAFSWLVGCWVSRWLGGWLGGRVPPGGGPVRSRLTIDLVYLGSRLGVVCLPI